jgi:membrane-associated protease RseP (regulator of RpoE activity)
MHLESGPCRAILPRTACLALAGLLVALGPDGVQGQIRKSEASNADTSAKSGGQSEDAAGPIPDGSRVVIQSVEPTRQADPAGPKEVAFLGVYVSTEEVSDVLRSQLGISPGAGLIVSYIAPESPAAKAGLQKNDVLVKLDDQWLLDGSQLRKLVRMHKEGDPIKLVLYRAGKQETVAATLGKTDASTPDEGPGDNPFRLFTWPQQQGAWDNSLREYQKIMRNFPQKLQGALPKEALSNDLKVLRDRLGNLKFDKGKVQDEVRRSLEAARRAVEQARRSLTNTEASLDPVRKALEDLARSHVRVDSDASVTIRSTANSTKSVVKADDSGTIVLVANPKPRLTAHDHDGHLLFDGEIATPEQRDQVPRDLWAKVAPLLEKMKGDDKTEAAEEESK